MEDKKTISYYTYTVGRDNWRAPKELVWNVLVENRNKIEVYNIFEHGNFITDLYKYKKLLSFKKFSEKVRRSLTYYFWSKCEWEIILTGWPAHISREEVERIKNNTVLVDLEKEKEDRETLTKEELFKKVEEEFKSPNEYVRHFGSVQLDVEEKIDVYDQIMLNWDSFINYLWKHKRFIKK